MPVAINAFFIANGLGKRLAQSNTDIFNGVMCVDMQIPFGVNVHINQAMPGNLIEHVVKKGHARYKRGFTRSIQVDFNFNLGFERVALDFDGSLSHGFQIWWVD